MTGTSHEKMSDMRWCIHMSNLLEEIMANPGTSALRIPLKILGEKLHEIASLAIEIDDPNLHLLMMDLTLYSAGDPAEASMEEIRNTRRALLKQIDNTGANP